MHSSRMQTAHSLTDCIAWYQAGGVCMTHMHAPQPCMPPGHAHSPPAMHAPPPVHVHPPGTHAPWARTPPLP